MAHSEVPPELHDFLREGVRGCPELQTLLAILEQPQGAGSLSSIAARAKIAADEVERALESLEEQQLIRQVPIQEVRGEQTGYAINERVASGPLLRLLARTYRDAPGAVMSSLNSNAIERVRLSALRTFLRTN